MMPCERSQQALRAAVNQAELSAPAISSWSVGMHVHHCALSVIGICRTLAASTPPPPRERSSLLASMVLRVGRMPRGRARAPEVVVPAENIPREELVALLDECERQLASVQAMNRDAWFRHFFFGVLKRDRAVKFIDMHNRHHLRIISDIVSSAR